MLAPYPKSDHAILGNTFVLNAPRAWEQGDQKIGEKLAQIFDKVAKTVAKPKKCPNIFFKAKFESQDLHQTFLNS